MLLDQFLLKIKKIKKKNSLKNAPPTWGFYIVNFVLDFSYELRTNHWS